MKMKSEEHVQVVQVNSHEQCEYRAVKGYSKVQMRSKVSKCIAHMRSNGKVKAKSKCKSQT